MAIPSYAYLKIKIPGPIGVFTMEAKTQRVLDCEQNNIELATATVIVVELRELSLQESPASTGPAMPPSSGAFKAAEDGMVMQIDAKDPTKTVQIGDGLIPK
jgi:hypothetical protein